MRPLTAQLAANCGVSVPISKRNGIGEKVNYKVVENYRFSTKIYLVEMNTKNIRLKMHICLFVISETVTSQKVDKKRKCYILYKNDTIELFPVGIPQTAGVCEVLANIAGPSTTYY
ncbi:hypothetical protein AVEN_115352-1 [Araneus ventricosus]|uniref:Uncharacterized protein n=1 Tax=Araneus ventricosus TaxID=182803 RepID=A0A4Y1ZY58_ARAVE|nr:hypothetical protein AVEN_115352-1 [Araneus ventricosus]